MAVVLVDKSIPLAMSALTKDPSTTDMDSCPPNTSTGTSTADMYQPEVVKPEWMELPPELQAVDFTKSIAWDKYQPYSDIPPVLTPLDTPPIFASTGHQRALCFHLHAVDGRARAGTIHFKNSAPPVPTPRFMPVGTKGTLKGVLPEDIPNMDCPMILANTYHLASQPGTELIDTVFGGLPKFMGGEEAITVSTDDTATTSTSNNTSNKRRRLFNLLTDSGGFQMVSLAALSVVTEDAVVFESPYTKGQCMTLRPEDSIRCQNEIGADVIMQLDDVISSVQNDTRRFQLATLRTLRWYDRCVQAHAKPETQNLYPILQGHLDTSPGGLREICLAGFRHRDVIRNDNDDADANDTARRTIPGFAVGGLAGGESKDDFWKVVDHACRHLPDNRPRYLMGVGYPLDLVVCTALGIDQYDCVYPTRTARFGSAMVDQGGLLKLKQHEFATQHDTVIMKDCPCCACSRGVSRARIHALLKAQNVLGVQLLTQHNVCYMMGLVQRMREAILQQRFVDFVHYFLKAHFLDQPQHVPSWVRDALQAAGISLQL